MRSDELSNCQIEPLEQPRPSSWVPPTSRLRRTSGMTSPWLHATTCWPVSERMKAIDVAVVAPSNSSGVIVTSRPNLAASGATVSTHRRAGLEKMAVIGKRASSSPMANAWSSPSASSGRCASLASRVFRTPALACLTRNNVKVSHRSHLSLATQTLQRRRYHHHRSFESKNAKITNYSLRRPTKG